MNYFYHRFIGFLLGGTFCLGILKKMDVFHSVYVGMQAERFS